MALLSGTEQEWNERAVLSNYRCRDCRELISFADQEHYFRQGLCTPCLNAREEERRAHSEARRRPQGIPAEQPQGEKGSQGGDAAD